MWRRLMDLEPAVLAGAITAVFTLLAAVGVIVSPDVPDAAIGLLALLPLLQAAYTRRVVTPNAKVAVIVPDPDRPDLVEAGPAVTTALPREIVEAAQAAGP